MLADHWQTFEPTLARIIAKLSEVGAASASVARLKTEQDQFEAVRISPSLVCTLTSVNP
jgi:hypothetical protein